MSRTTRSRVLVDHAAPRRPELAAAIRVRVLVRFVDGYAPVRIDFRGDARRREGAPKAPGLIAGTRAVLTRWRRRDPAQRTVRRRRPSRTAAGSTMSAPPGRGES
jgi:hypothetical protein